ncbi:MAG: choice-of-anchor L domain-containing protein [Bacteroidetes bacterium]|nr:choice-of-anchor L domain-containing protein [Bacteroidota bacterium]
MKHCYNEKYVSRYRQSIGAIMERATRRSISALLLLLLLSQAAFAQIAVTTNSNTQALAQLLAGNGVTISNWTKTCANNGTGTFTNSGTNLGVPGGIVLASGNVSSIPNSANAFASTQFTNNGDAQLSTLTTGTIYDKCILEFDIVPQGPILKFDYVFASEEYPEWVCSQFNDVFGFFISGPNPGGGNFTNKNLAIIPNTTLPVTINSVNGGSLGANAGGGTCNGANQSLAYSSYYVNNQTPLNPNIVYDGMTTVLSAITAVTPCQTYHLKIAIADVADRIYDSGVFLQAYSFTSNPISVSATSALDYAGFSSAYEGCVGGTFTLTLNQPQLTDVYANIVVSGTATNGTDYTSIPATVFFPAGTTVVNIDLNPLADGITEPAENVTVAVLDPCTGNVSSSASISIRDDIPPTISVSDSTLCLGQSTQLIANGGVSYSWSPPTGLSSTTAKNPIATPLVTTTYTVSMQWGACVKTASATVYVSNPSMTINAAPAGVVCNGGNVVLSAAPSSGVSPYSYLWNNASTSSSVSIGAGGTYTVTATDSYGCSASASRSVTISNLSISGISTNVSCVGGNNGAVDITVTGANAPFTYNWGGGVSSQDRTNLAAGTYTVTASNTVGCSVTATYIITQPATNLTTSATNTTVNCFGGNNGSINLTVNGGVSPYSYLWNNSATTEDLNNITAGTYTVTVTDFNGCTALRSVTVSQPAVITTSSTQVNLLCNAASTGSIDLTVGGGVGAFTYAWSNGASTQDITNLPAGTYQVTVADGNGCTANRSVNVTQPTALSIAISSVNPSCFGSANGSLTLTVTGGTGAYVYNWGGGITSQNRTGLAAGSYSVTVTDASGCTASASSILTQPSAALSATAVPSNVSCNGGNNGSINLSVSGGTSAYSYNWGGGVTTQNRTSLVAGIYTVTVTDSQACTATASAAINQPVALSASNVKTDVSCNGGNNGSINLTVSGGNTPYSYNWGGGVITEDRINLSAGTYSVTATDASGCSVTSSAIVAQPAALVLSQTQVNVICNGGSNGSINITVSGGSPAYTYNWGGGITTEDRAALTAGVYTVTATDSKGCTVSGSASITEPAIIAITELVSNASCAVGNDGSITLSVSGGSAPYSYNWGGGILTQNRTGLIAGTYTVTVTDNAGCTVSKPIAVTQIGSGISLSSGVTNVSCFGGNNGAIDITVIGGTAPITYNWGGGVTTEDRASLSASTYSVTVTDGLGCSAISTNNIVQPTSIQITRTITNVLCFGAGTGNIDVTVSGGTGVMSYNWGGGITTEDRVAVVAGTYNVTVTDANSCTASASAVVSQPASALNLSTLVSNVSCFGAASGGVDLTVTGGTPGYLYSWSNGSISQDLSNVVSNTYTVTVLDGNGCSATTSGNVSQPLAALNVTLTPTNLNCNGISSGAINTTVSGGTGAYTYNWGGGISTANRTSLAAGNYAVTVNDAASCSASAAITITQPGAITINSTKTDVLCNGGNNGAINVTAIGGTGAYIYNWGGGVTTEDRNGLSAGTYSLTVTDGNGCNAVHSATIIQPSALTLTMNSGTSVCLNPTGTATAVTNNSGTAPYNFVWSNGGANSQTQNGLAPGNISVTVTDANSCSASAAVAVGLSGNNTNANFTNTSPLCGPNAAVTFTHTGSSNIISHFWDFGNGATSSLNNPLNTYASAGTYAVTHIVVRGFCEDSVVRTIVVNARPQLTAVNSNVSCFGSSTGAIDLTPAGSSPFTYNWGGGISTQDRTGLAPGSFTVTVTDANACTATLSASITQPAVLAVSNSVTNVTCNGGTNGAINITATGGTTGYVYNWGGGVTTEDRNTLASGSYTVTVTDANGCTATTTVSVAQPNAINISAAVSAPSCNSVSNGSIQLNVTGGTGAYGYNWGGGVLTQNRNSIPAGAYAVTVTDANLCTASATYTLLDPASLAVSLTPTAALCFGAANGSIISSITGGTAPFAFTWNDGNTNANRSTLLAGNYAVSVIDDNGCSVTASTTVAQPATAVSVVVNNTNTLSCYGDANGIINITANGGNPVYAFNWSDGVTTEDRSNILGGTYFVTVTDQNGCFATVSATVNQPSTLINIDTLIVSDVLCYNASTGSINVNVSGGTAPYNYNWGGGITSQNRTNLAAGNYGVTVLDNNGCSATGAASIAQPSLPISATIAVTDVSCFAGANGAADLTISNGVSPYSYNWNTGMLSEDLSNLSSGTYSVTVTDINSCTATASAVVSQPTSLNVAVASVANVSCFAGNNGSITISISGATPSYTYNWGGGITTQNRTGLSAGSYSVTVTDIQSCTASVNAVVTQPSAALAPLVSSTGNVSCFSGNNGFINTVVSGGTAPYSYNWGGGIVSPNITNLTAGTYTLTVSDAQACTATVSATITQPAAAVSAVVTSVSNVSCFNGSNGAINILASGGTSPYTYDWGGGVNTQNRTGLTAGNYSVSVSDINSCSTTISVVVGQPAAALSVTTVTTPVSCFGGSNATISTNTTGGTSPYNYNWNGGVTTPNRSGLSAGSYSLTVTDANSCTTSTSATIVQPTALAASSVATDVLCSGGNDGAVNLTVAGGTSGYTYNWSNGSVLEDLANLMIGNYTVTATDANGCTVAHTAAVSEPAPLQATTITANVSCFGGTNGSVQLSVSGGVIPYMFNWSSGVNAQTVSSLQAGSYSVTVYDSHNCTTTLTVNIVEPSAIVLSTAVTNVSCHNGNTGAIDLTVSGGTSGYTYNWGGGIVTQDRSNLTAGTYTVTVTDANTCTVTANASVIQPNAIAANTAVTQVLCYGNATGAINLTVFGGTNPYNYNWGGGVIVEDRVNIPAGSYTVTITDANACSASVNTVVAQPAAALSATVGSVVNVGCFGANTGSINMNISGGTAPYTYLWNDGVTTANRSSVAAGTYTHSQ